MTTRPRMGKRAARARAGKPTSAAKATKAKPTKATKATKATTLVKAAAREAVRRPLTAFTPPDHDPLADARLRPLVERYAALAGATVEEAGPHLVELGVAEEDRGFFDGRERVLVAFAVPALEESPEAEMAVVGSPFMERLLSAIRTRGGRYALGAVAPSVTPDAAVSLALPVRSGRAGQPRLKLERHPVGQLLARVVIRAGATVEEHLVEGGVFDLATGAPLPRYAAEHGLTALRAERRARGAKKAGGVRLASPRPMSDLMDVMIADLRARLAPRVEQLRRDAERALASELIRIDGYYRSMLEDAGARGSEEAAAEAARAIEVEHARRRLEEERRHQVRAVVHPLQLVEMEMLVQRAEWPLSADDGRKGAISARRFLHGAAHWGLVCPSCARAPETLVVGDEGDVGCEACRPEPPPPVVESEPFAEG